MNNQTVTRRSREELLTAVSQLEKMGFELTGQWRLGLNSLSYLDVLVKDSFPEALFYVRNFFDYSEIMSSRNTSEGAVQYKGAPLLLRLRHVPRPRAHAALLLHTTGPHELLNAFRRCAKDRTLTLDPDGLFSDLDDKQVDPGDSEEFIFNRLGFEYMHPVYRNHWRQNLIPTICR